MRYSTAVQPHEDLDLVVFLREIQLCTIVAVEVKQRVDRHGADLCTAKFHVRCCDAFFSFQRMRPPSHAVKQHFRAPNTHALQQRTLLRQQQASLLVQRPCTKAYSGCTRDRQS